MYETQEKEQTTFIRQFIFKTNKRMINKVSFFGYRLDICLEEKNNQSCLQTTPTSTARVILSSCMSVFGKPMMS